MKENKNRLVNLYTFIKSNGYVSIQNLISEFNVSKSTIIRDLNSLSEKGLVERIHGGARIYQDDTVAQFHFRENINSEEKRCIAKEAAKLISDDDVIFLDVGSTCFHLYKEITAQNVTVFTPNLAILSYEPMPNILHLYALEGEISHKNYSIGGNLTIENMRRISPRKIFFSISGLNERYIIQCTNEIQMSTNIVIKKMIGEKILLLDSSKIGINKPFQSYSLDSIDVLITDKNIKQEDADALNKIVNKFIISK